MTSPIGQSGRDQKEAGGDIPAEERITSAARPTAPGNSGSANEPVMSDNEAGGDMPAEERITSAARPTAPGNSGPANEPVVSDDERIVPDAGRTAPGDSGPANEPVVSDDERIVPDDERIVMLDDDPLVLDDDQDVLDKDDVASEGGSAAAASAAAGPSSELTPGSAAARRSVSEGTRPGGRWPEIQSMFVDDPRASVELAARLVDDSVQTLIASVKERQHALISSWQPAGASTEELRGALRAYRTFWSQVDSFCQDA